MNIPVIIQIKTLDAMDSIELNPINIEDISQYKQVSAISDPVNILLTGLFVCALCGLAFGYLIQVKLTNFEKSQISPLPMKNANTTLTWFGFFTGLTLFFSGGLKVFSFSTQNSIIFSFVISMIFGISMWKAIEDLLLEVKEGKVKEIDEYF